MRLKLTTEEQQDSLRLCCARNILTDNKIEQFDTTLECIHEDHILLANCYESLKKSSDNKMSAVTGFVRQHKVTALIDTGCSSGVVKRQFIEKNQLTIEHVYMLMGDKIIQKVPHAIISIDTHIILVKLM